MYSNKKVALDENCWYFPTKYANITWGVRGWIASGSGRTRFLFTMFMLEQTALAHWFIAANLCLQYFLSQISIRPYWLYPNVNLLEHLFITALNFVPGLLCRLINCFASKICWEMFDQCLHEVTLLDFVFPMYDCWLSQVGCIIGNVSFANNRLSWLLVFKDPENMYV